MIVVVARDATLPNLDLESISFLEKHPHCDPVGTTSAFAIYQFPLTTCGTVMMVRAATHFTVPFNSYLFLSDCNDNCNAATLL